MADVPDDDNTSVLLTENVLDSECRSETVRPLCNSNTASEAMSVTLSDKNSDSEFSSDLMAQFMQCFIKKCAKITSNVQKSNELEVRVVEFISI